MYGQTVQTQIRLLLSEQSDLGLHSLLFQMCFLTKYPSTWPLCFNFSLTSAMFSGVQKFRNFTGNKRYRKVPKFSDAKKLCCNLPKTQNKEAKLYFLYFVKMMQNGIANSEDPDQTAPLGVV